MILLEENSYVRSLWVSVKRSASWRNCTDCAAYWLGKLWRAVVRHGIGCSSTWLSTNHAQLLWTPIVRLALSCLAVARSLAQLHEDDDERPISERRFGDSVSLHTVE